MTPEAISEVMNQIDEKHDRAHDRLRMDLQATVATIASITATVDRNYRYFEDQNAAMRLRLNTIEQLASMPVDATKLSLSTKAILSLVGAVVGGALLVAGSFWTLQGALQNQSRDIAQLQKAVDELKQARLDDKREAQQKLSDFLNQRLETALAVTTGKGTKK